jgi:hypothetical protein
MYDRRFFGTKLGIAAMISISAMALFNVVALTQQYAVLGDTVLVVAPMVELA